MEKYAFFQGMFVAAAYDKDQFPSMQTADGKTMREMAVVGASNVGKSSLINSLLKGKKIAKTSSTPGKTQSINFFSIDHQLSLVDLPGYGYAKVSKELKQKWSLLIEYYLNTRKSLQLILFLIDIRRTPSDQDLLFTQWASHHQIPLLFVFTKADKIKRGEREKYGLNSINKFQQIFHHAPFHFLYYSIKETHARMELIHQINSFFT